MQISLTHFSHKKGTNFWHLEWCPKYRYKMMRKLENKNLVEAAIRKAAHEHGIIIHYIAVMPDHVHALVTLPHGMTDSEAFQLLKGRSAHILFRVKEKFRLRYPKGHFWSPGGFAVTVGYNDLNSMITYIQGQAEHYGVVFT
ncbi:IS200/IS605 family transposase [Candidatus Woesearchaeota archaeon]|nr:IS200/IS605 family transposase [Candidatus Woesearchaeota archaeon]